jgi:hypothetical protein
MNAVSVYRRQDVMREICRRIGYQGRFVWLISTPEVHVLANKYGGNSRLRFKCIDITDYTIKKTILRDGKPIKLDSSTVVVALPTLRGRRRDLLCFMLCSEVRAQTWAIGPHKKLSPEELAVLQGLDKFDPSTMAVAHAICVYRGLVDPRGRLTDLGSVALRKLR